MQMKAKVEKRKRESITDIKNSLAKINLFLDTIFLRKNGFHEIETILTEIQLEDILIFSLTESNKIKISCNSNELKEVDNIIYKIACFLKDKYRVKKGLDISLKKNIPISAGLGGGSSNAALTIKNCNTLWNLKLSKSEMHKIAARFGSDINFFLEGGIAYLNGKGENVSKISTSLKVENLLLVNPRIQISSREAYSWSTIKPEKVDKFQKLKDAIDTNDIPSLCKNLYNSLENGVFTRYPIIKGIKEKMLDLGARGSLMSGSGSTVFGIFDSRDKMQLAEKYFNRLDFWTYRTEIGKTVR